jgi:hypothetical protein
MQLLEEEVEVEVVVELYHYLLLFLDMTCLYGAIRRAINW